MKIKEKQPNNGIIPGYISSYEDKIEIICWEDKWNSIEICFVVDEDFSMPLIILSPDSCIFYRSFRNALIDTLKESEKEEKIYEQRNS